MSVADIVVARLREAGVRALFGMPGGGSNLDLVAACGRLGLPFVMTATETRGAIASLAQAEITGCPGACLTTLGPGVASAVNGIACARLERAPLIVLTDALPADSVFEHQRIDHRALLAPLTKWSAAIDASAVADVMRHAIACAMTEPKGPVHLDCPGDALAQDADAPVGAEAARSVHGFDAGRSARTADGAARFSAVARARRPLLLAGLGARDARTSVAIRRLCTGRRVPAMITYKAKGVVADSDPWFAGVFTNGAIERAIVDQADVIFTVGLDRVELLPRPWTYAQPVVDVSCDDLPDLAAALAESSWDRPALQAAVAAQRASICIETGSPLAPHHVVQLVQDAAPRSRVTVDAGAHMFPATMLWPAHAPNDMLISNGLSTIGFALPAAIGAALLDRERSGGEAAHTIALTGDGGLLMCAGELVTAARERLDIVVVVFNDAALSLIDVKQTERRLERAGVEIGRVDWRALASSAGVRGFAAATPDALAGAMKAAMAHRGPSLVDVRVDASGYAALLRAIRG